jgi:hypothetical protein
MARAALLRISVLAAACISASVCAQPAATKLTPEIEELIGTASSLRTEYSADILLRLIESGKINDRDRRRDLLERVFESASGALEPFPLQDVISTGDTRERVSARSFEMRLDALSIRLRAVELLLEDDPRAAREMFTRILPLDLPPAACDRALIPKVDAFYTTALLLFDQSFTKAERESEDDIAFLRGRIAEITSLPQLLPALKIVKRVPRLSATLAAPLARIDADDREWRALQTELEMAVSEMGIPPILEAWRALVASHAQAVQCPENSASITSLEPPERFKALAFALNALHNGTDMSPEQWRIGVTKYLDELANYRTASGDEEEVVFLVKAALYLVALDYSPEGYLLARALDDYLGFLATSPLEASRPMEWLHAFFAPKRTSRMIEAMKRSKDSVMAAYVALQSLREK